MSVSVRLLLVVAATVLGVVCNGLNVRMAPEQQVVYDPELGGVADEFKGLPGTAVADTEYSALARFVIETEPTELYAPPTLHCAEGCPKIAAARIDDSSDGCICDVGNVDAARLLEYYEHGSLLELLVWYDCTGAETGEILLNVSLQLVDSPSSLEDARKLQQDLLAGDGDGDETTDPRTQLFSHPNGAPVVFFWRKRCPAKNTVHRGVAVTIDNTDETAVVSAGAATADYVVVGADETSSEFTLTVSEGSVAWAAPTVTATAGLTVEIAGSAAQAGFAEFDDGVTPASLVIMYGRCDVPKSTVTVSWALLPPYAPIRFNFTKTCGGGSAPGFAVTVNMPQGAVQAVVDGRALQPFVDAKEVVGQSADATTLWVSAPEKSPVSVLRVLVSQSPTAIFKPTLTGEIADGAGAKQLAGEQALLLKYDCEHQGTATVTVTFQLDKYKAVSLAFTKQCPAPGVVTKKQSKSWSPTGLVLGLTGSAICIGAVIAVWRAAGNPQKVRPKRKDPTTAL